MSRVALPEKVAAHAPGFHRMAFPDFASLPESQRLNDEEAAEKLVVLFGKGADPNVKFPNVNTSAINLSASLGLIHCFCSCFTFPGKIDLTERDSAGDPPLVSLCLNCKQWGPVSVLQMLKCVIDAVCKDQAKAEIDRNIKIDFGQKRTVNGTSAFCFMELLADAGMVAQVFATLKRHKYFTDKGNLKHIALYHGDYNALPVEDQFLFTKR